MKKRFDAVAWMRKRRTEIDEEDKGLSWEEKYQKTLEILKDNPQWQRLRDRVVNPSDWPLKRVAGDRK